MWNHTGSDGGAAGCEGSGCHAFSSSTSVLMSMEITYTDGTPITNNIYIPGRLYTIRLKGTYPGTGYPVFGFQFSGSGVNDGNFVTGPGIHSQVIAPFQLLQHQYPLTTTGTNNRMAEVSFLWQAPPAGSGVVSFYGVVLMGNNDTSPQGDIANTIVRTVYEATTSVEETAGQSPIFLYPNPVEDRLYLTIDNTRESIYTVQVTTLNGISMVKSTLKTTSGTLPWSLSVAGWPSGMYMLELVSGTSRTVMPFIKH